MPAGWEPSDPGVLRLPSGRLVRGRALRAGLPSGRTPEVGLYLLGGRPPAYPWEVWWLRWADGWLPRAPLPELRVTLTRLLERSAQERVEVACSGGRGRTGTTLAALAVLDGLSPPDAVHHVRHHYHRRSVETPWQRHLLTRLSR